MTQLTGKGTNKAVRGTTKSTTANNRRKKAIETAKAVGKNITKVNKTVASTILTPSGKRGLKRATTIGKSVAGVGLFGKPNKKI
tara:strand:- start:67 stop:318 length:252 start_codon:yes stop_codon:yes gene_type:complete